MGRMESAASGALSGFAATLVMSVEMVAARRLGFIEELPPHVITARALARAPGPGPSSHAGSRGAGWLAHLAFGTTMGAVYGLLFRPRRSVPAGVSGVGYGLCLWLASYVGALPILGLLPPPHEDRSGRPATMIPAHIIYGAVVGVLTARLRRRAGRS
jgi:hypothetical protein